MIAIAPARSIPRTHHSQGSPAKNNTSLRSSLASHVPALTAHAQQLCRNREQAEDLVQDTLLRALRFESSFSVGSNLRAWLHQILSNTFISQCRRKRRERSALHRFSADPCSWLHAEPAPTLRILSPRVHRALSQLPEKFARTVSLVDLHDHGYQEAAHAMGSPVGTVMSRLFRGRRMLRDALDDTMTLPEAA